MTWRVCASVFIVAVGMKTLQQVALEYKLRPDESPLLEQAGVIVGTAIMCYLVLTVGKKKPQP
jgi:hypothetical protein